MARDTVVRVLVSAEERASWELAAGHEALSAWVRRACEAFQGQATRSDVPSVAETAATRGGIGGNSLAYASPRREVRPDPRKGGN